MAGLFGNVHTRLESKQAYVARFATALDETIRAGYVRKCDRAEYLAKAQAVTVAS